MSILTDLNPYALALKIGAAVLAASLLIGGGFYAGYRWQEGAIANLKLADSQEQTANIKASLVQLQDFIGTMHAADTDYGTKLDAINAQFAFLNTELSHATHTPLPADCKPDADRLRVLSDAVSAANQSAPAGK